MNQKLFNAIEEVAKNQKPRFVSLTYTSKKTGEVAKHTILLGASYEKAKEKDLQKLLILQPRLSGIKLVACNELIESYKKPAGENENYTCLDVYEETDIKGLKRHKETGNFHLIGYIIQKTTIKQGEFKLVNSSEKTIEKNKLRKLGRLGKMRQYELTPLQVESMKLNGKTLTIN